MLCPLSLLFPLCIAILASNSLFLFTLSSTGIGKKVEKIGKKKKSSEVLYWLQSIKNHVYWCASSSNGDEDLVEEKWMSLFNHLLDVHKGHGKRYKSCPHGKIERDWLEKGAVHFQFSYGIVSNILI